MPASVKDVAERAGVSSATVSRVLTNKPHVREELRQRVLAAVRELGYQPNHVARSLRVRRSKIIGLIISDIQNPFFHALVRAVEDSAYEHGYAIFLCNSDEDAAKEALYIDLMRAERVAGLVISPTDENNNLCRKLLDAGVPVVSVDRRMRGLEVDTVVIDNIGGAFELVSHLIDDGHRRIGAVLGIPAATTGHERREGYLKALQAHGLPVLPELIKIGMPKTDTGYQLTGELLDRPDPPTALFTGNNLLTIGALQAIEERGLVIPDEIALVAFDEMVCPAVTRPTLTVIEQPIYVLGQTAARLLLQRITDPDRPAQEVMLKPALRIRQSCAHHQNSISCQEINKHLKGLP